VSLDQLVVLDVLNNSDFVGQLQHVTYVLEKHARDFTLRQIGATSLPFQVMFLNPERLL
jgi:gamma-glutamyl:cysteine ligase YbdK (ATP-grasp superfamily)